MNTDTFWDYTTCMRLLMLFVSSGLVSLVAVQFCLLASMVVHGFRSVLLSAFSFAVHLSVVMLYNTYLIRKTHQRKSNEKEGEEIMIKREDYQLPPKEGFILTHFLTVADVKRSAEFYLRILGGTVVRSGEPTIIHIANSWLILNVGGGPTDDKPNVTLRPPQNPNEVSSFLNIRVADIRASYEEWRRRGAEFLTEPKDHGVEIRCYMRDPDDYIIEVGQTTAPQA